MDRPDRDWRSLFPFDSHWQQIEGFRLHYVDEGPHNKDQQSANKPTLVLVHGNPTWAFYYRELIAAWSQEYRVIAVDHLGCGLSEKPAAGPYRLADRVRQLVTFIRSLSLRNVTLVGHDWGGCIATGAAEELSGIVTRLVLMNTSAFRAPMIPWRIAVCRWPVIGPLGVRGGNAFLRAAYSMALEQRERITPQVRAGYDAPYGSWAERVAIQRFVEDIPRSPHHPSYDTLVKIEERLPELHAIPKLLIWGMKDWCFTPWFLERFENYWPEAQVLRLTKAGHWLIEDAPAEVIGRVEQFLSET